MDVIHKPVLLLLAVGLAWSASEASGQASPRTPPELYLGLSVGPYLEFPDPFSDPYCDEANAAVEASVGYRLTSALTLEGAVAGGGHFGDLVCVTPSLVPPPPGTRFERTIYDESIEDGSLFATTASLVYDFAPTLSRGARVRAGVGRLWRKELNTWFVGAGYRMRLGGVPLTVDLDRWHVSIPAVHDQVLVGQDGQHIIQASEDIDVSGSGLALRIGIEVGIR